MGSLISDETNRRYDLATTWVERHSARLSTTQPQQETEEPRTRPQMSAVVMEAIETPGKQYWVQPKRVAPNLNNWLIRFKPDRDPAVLLEDFDIVIVVGGAEITITFDYGWNAPELLSAINGATGGVLSKYLWCKLGQGAPTAEGGKTCNSWFLSCSSPILQNVKMAEPEVGVEPQAEIFFDPESPFYFDPIKAYKQNDARKMLAGTLVMLVDMPNLGWVIAGGLGSFSEATPAGTGCGECNPPQGTNDVDLTAYSAGLIASEFYSWNPFCSDILQVVFTRDPENNKWVGDADGGMSVTCLEETQVFEAWIDQIGDGHTPTKVRIHLKLGTDEWIWVNRESWQPDQDWEFTLVSGPATCPCGNFRKRTCLHPQEEKGF